MPHAPARVLQLDLFLSDARAYRDALARYETIRPVLRQERPLAQQPVLPVEPSTHAQRLALVLGPEHLLLRFRTYDEYPTEEQARWRIIELLEVGFRPRRVAKLLAIQPAVVYHWKRRFAALGLLG